MTSDMTSATSRHMLPDRTVEEPPWIEIRRRELTLAQVFEHADNDPQLATIPIVDVLRNFCKKTERAHELLEDASVNVRRRLRGVGQRQRAALIAVIDQSENTSG